MEDEVWDPYASDNESDSDDNGSPPETPKGGKTQVLVQAGGGTVSQPLALQKGAAGYGYGVGMQLQGTGKGMQWQQVQLYAIKRDGAL